MIPVSAYLSELKEQSNIANWYCASSELRRATELQPSSYELGHKKQECVIWTRAKAYFMLKNSNTLRCWGHGLSSIQQGRLHMIAKRPDLGTWMLLAIALFLDEWRLEHEKQSETPTIRSCSGMRDIGTHNQNNSLVDVLLVYRSNQNMDCNNQWKKK